MNSSRLEYFNQVWEKKRRLTTDEHWEEILHYMRETYEKKQRATDNAQNQLRGLRDRDVTLVSFSDEAQKIKDNLDATLEAIEKEYQEKIRVIEEIQRKEMANLEKAHREALTARPFIMNDISPDHSATEVLATTNQETGVNTKDAASPRLSAGTSTGFSRDRMLPTQDDTPTIIALGGHDKSAKLAKHFSCTIQPLQELAELRDHQSLPVDSPVNPLPTPDSEHGASRTVTFDEVYQNGQAKHKDTIVEFPSDSGRWYILKCEEHKMRFGPRPLIGAGKHLNSQLHGGLYKGWAVAIEKLGYRVIDCTKELASLNNEVVRDAIARGYKPVSILNPENKIRRRRYRETLENASQGADAAATSLSRKSPSSPPRKRHKADRENPTEIITNPKTFHVYYYFWKGEQLLYPVMILAWDDQKPGGLEHDLAGTGLLNKDSNPPNCYIYKDTHSGKNKAIAGWAPGFEDGGSKVNQRKFPAMFFDPKQQVSWVSANLLSEFPLFKLDPPMKRSHPFNVARRWVAKNKGFASWEEFEEAQKGKGGDKRPRLVSTPSVSPISDIDNAEDNSDSESGSDTESSAKSYTSNVTEKVLQKMRDRAGEITGDSDYTGSDTDSTSDDEHEKWEEVETTGQRWAWYDLRKKSRTDPEETESSASTHEGTSLNNEAGTPVRKCMDSARSLSKHACTEEHLVQVGDDQSSRRTPLPNRDGVNEVNQATPLPRTPTPYIFRTPASLINRLSLSSVGIGESSSGRVKRGRSEERSETGNVTPRKQSAKKPRQNLEIPDTEMDMSSDSQPVASPLLPVEPLSEEPLGPERNSEISDDEMAMSIDSQSVHSNSPPRPDKNPGISEDQMAMALDSQPTASPLPPGVPLSMPTEPLGPDQDPGTTGDQMTISLDSQLVNSPLPPASPISKPKEPLGSEQSPGILDNEVVTSMDSQPATSPLPPAKPLFKPKEPLETAVFELSSYIKGDISWSRESEATSVRLYYGEGERMVGTMDAPVDIVIDPAALRGIAREEIPDTKGNVVMTLFSKHPDDAPIKVVFNRAMGSKVGIGKVQSRRFLQWARSIVPTLPLLGG
ncbi:hypothetical protein F4680DRAFT_410523 [Xylaria scruposa]|nr:hypothetical protein F4680DRAFT_410523 [Xylaria scruposa]